GNEIIVKKNRVRVPKGSANRPTSNPLPPQSEAYASYKNTSVSAEQVFESVSQQTPNFGTEQVLVIIFFPFALIVNQYLFLCSIIVP
ncbi:hypothetical protein IFM89_039594, partial [Coptis chinensis]